MTREEFRELNIGHWVRLLVAGTPFPQGSIGSVDDCLTIGDIHHIVVVWYKIPFEHKVPKNLSILDKERSQKLTLHNQNWYSERDAEFLERVVRKRRQ